MTPKNHTDRSSPETPGQPEQSAVHCPSCGKKGKPVKPVTIESLVTEDARTRAGAVDGFRFCAEPGCDVACFNPESSERILNEEVRVVIGQKKTSSERTVCSCFDHTAADVEAEVAATGTSKIPDEIGAKCKQGLDRCEETNPQGSCCLGNIRVVLEEAQGRAPATEVVSAGMAASAVAADSSSGRDARRGDGGA